MPTQTKPPLVSCLLGGLMLAALSARSSAEKVEENDDALTFVYIHGFGGLRENPKFCRNLREFLAGKGTGSKVINYEWDSVAVDPLKPAASWLKSQQRADAEAAKFKAEIIDKQEAAGSRYVLVGFSVGSRVILRALEQCDARLEGLAGVYFLGSAITKDTTLAKRVALPEGMKITNYHSPLRDKVHAMAFKMMSDTPAGGQDGFDDQEVFENLPVSCTHAHKGVGVTIDYSGLAEAIGAIELFQNGTRIPGDTSFNIKSPVGGGDVWWNKVMRVQVDNDDGSATFEIEQHNARPGYYRALRVGEGGQRTRVARGGSLHAILGELGVK